MDLRINYIIYLFIFINGSTLFGQAVGINTTEPKTTLDVNGAISLRASSVSLNNGDNYNVAVGDFSLINVTAPSSFNINTITPQDNADGQIVTLVNQTIHNMTIINNDGDAVNSVLCPSNVNLNLSDIYSAITLQYNRSLERWVVLRYSEGMGRKIYHSVGNNVDANIDSNIFAPMADMSITFTPQNSLVYVSVSVSGNMDITEGKTNAYADFRLVNVTDGNKVVSGSTVIATDNDSNDILSAWNIRMVMIPVDVEIGVPTTIKMEWRRNGVMPGSLNCLTDTYPNLYHRSMTIID